MLRKSLLALSIQLAFGVVLLAFLAKPSYGQGSHQLFTQILQAHVHAGMVNYAALCDDRRLDTYLEQLTSTDPADLEDQGQALAFWINAYNAFTLKIVSENYPISSINELHRGGLHLGLVLKTTVWDKKFVRINGRRLSLNDIEHKIIRPTFRDARIHFALVCAARSCPPLRTEAFEAERLDEQLDEQGRTFLSEPDKNRFDLASKTAHLSKIFDWYQNDFGESQAELLTYLARFLPTDLAREIRSQPLGWQIKHTEYDWALNDLMTSNPEISAEGKDASRAGCMEK